MGNKRVTQIYLDRLYDEQDGAIPKIPPTVDTPHPTRKPSPRILRIPHHNKRFVRRETEKAAPQSNAIFQTPPTLKDGFPWGRYESDNYERDLAGWATIAVRRAQPRELVVVKALPRSPGMERPSWSALCHENVIAVLDLFRTEHSLYVVFGYAAISFHEIVRCPRHPNEKQLAVMVEQVCAIIKLNKSKV
jgi:hypothetical protein